MSIEQTGRTSRTISLASAVALAAAAASTYGQERPSAEPSDGEPLESIVVTGTLLRRAEYAEKSPMQVLDRKDFETFSPDTFNDIAKNLTVSGGAEFQNETGNLIGMSQLNIRGLGLGSSLVLINGRRGGVSTIADGGGNQFFDINQLPLSMVERIDILTDGASATYGSQAVAGVANIITRKGFEGLELSAKYSDAANHAEVASLAMGSRTERGALNVYASYRTNTRVDRTDLDWLLERLGHTGDLTTSVLTSTTGAPGSYQRTILDPTTGRYIAAPGTNTVADPDCNAAGGLLVSGRCRFDFSDQTSIVPEENRFQVFTEGSYYASEQLEFFFEGSFSRNRINRSATPSLFEQGLSQNAILIPASHPFNFFVRDPANPNRIVYVNPANWNNAVHQAVDVRALARPLGSSFKDDDLEIDIDYWRGVGGFAVDIAQSWNASLSYMHATSKRTVNRPYEFVKQIVNDAALNGTWNPFGTAIANPTLVSPKDGVSVAANSEAVLRSLWRFGRDEAETTQAVYDLVVSGTAFDLAGGPLGLAVGAQQRRESLTSFVDSLAASGQGALQTTVTTAPIRGSDEVTSYFAEAVLPFIEDVEVQLAVRHERFDGGIDTTDPKVAARWDAADWLALRGSFGTSFQAPSVRQKSTSTETAFIQDPVFFDSGTGSLRCGNPSLVANNTVVFLQGSDDLKPQEAESYTFGLILRPARKLDVSIDYWRFDYTDLITPDEGAQAIVLNDCADGIPNDPRITRDAGGQLRTVTSFFINAGSVVTDGVDLAASYVLPAGRLGEFSLGMNATWINTFDIRLNERSPTIDGRGNRNFTNPFRSTPVWRGNTSLNWASGAHSANLTVRYIDGYRNDQGNTTVDRWTTLDAQYSLTLPRLFASETTLTVGANNLTDEEPPTLGDRVRPGYDDVIHDVRGRIAYVEVQVSF